MVFYWIVVRRWGGPKMLLVLLLLILKLFPNISKFLSIKYNLKYSLYSKNKNKR